MKTDHEEKKWIWQAKGFPKFIYKVPNLDALYYKFGQLQAIQNMMGEELSKELLVDMLENEAVATSAIEGEVLQRSSVRSSINKILRLGLSEEYKSSYQIDALIEIIVDAKTNLAKLDKDRLSSWHKALFPTNQSGLRKITSGEYRQHNEDMQIVSGPLEKERVHYIAPPSSTVEGMTDEFLRWLNSNNEQNLVIKAGIAHLYFVLIHPFEDGNGRLTRAITDYVLSKANLVNANFYSIASAIHNHRKEYYEILDKTCQNLALDISDWLEWFADIVSESIDTTLAKVEVVIVKTMFWDKHLNTQLNDRQKKVIQKMISCLPEKFEGGMKVHKYMALTKTTRITASRDLSDLVQKGVLKVFGSGRGVYYELAK